MRSLRSEPRVQWSTHRAACDRRLFDGDIARRGLLEVGDTK